MGLQETRDAFEQIVDQSRQSFLNNLALIHIEWHNTRSLSGSPIGFLSFHREMIKYNKRNRENNNLSPVPKAFTISFINSIRTWDSSLMNRTSPTGFSNGVESWHNGFHTNVAWPDFHLPDRNIRDDRFWQFHKFIDNRFKKWMSSHNRTYSGINHDIV